MPENVSIPQFDANAFLENMAEGLKGATEPVPQGSVPEGDYQFKVTEIVPGTSRQGGQYINIVGEIVGGPDDTVGAEHVAHFNLISEGNFQVWMNTLRRLGVRTSEPTAIMQALEERIGTTWDITVKISNGFVNTYFNRRVN